MAEPFARIPLALPVDPMLCKAAASVPTGEPGAWLYEPKWDGFRCVIERDGDDVELASRGSKPLTRYFPEVVEAVRRHLPDIVVLDAEIVVRAGTPGAQRLAWDALSQRIHPAASRIEKLARETPAEVVLFDLLTLGDPDGGIVDWSTRPFAERRAALVRLGADLAADAPIHVTASTTDPDLARRWFEQFEGAGLDGVIAKPAADAYAPGKRALVKVKHARTCEVVVWGYRVHKSGAGVGSLMLGLFDDAGELRPVGGASAFTTAYRSELEALLQPLVKRDPDGRPQRFAGERSRFTAAGKDTSVILVEPELVAEVRFDQLEGDRFRHTVQFARWRPDRTPESCLLAQIERPIAYDLDAVLRA